MTNFVKIGTMTFAVVAVNLAIGVGLGAITEKLSFKVANMIMEHKKTKREIEEIEREFGVKIVAMQ